MKTLSLELSSQNNESRKVIQCHFTAWPDKGVPATGTAMLEFYKEVKMIEKANEGAVIFHCRSAV